MPKQDKLFTLIKSLNKSEKRYFSIYTQMHVKGEDNDYMKLFKEFEKQEELQEDLIKENLKGEKLMDHYAVIKSYLYDLILKSMRSYTKHSVTKKILDLLQDVEFLYSKGIFDQSYQLVRKARELAQSSQKYGILEEVLNWEKNILQAEGFYGATDIVLNGIYKDQQTISSELELENSLWKTSADLFNYYYTQGKTRSKVFIETFSPVIEGENAVHESRITSVKGYYYFKLRKIYYYYIQGNSDKSIAYSHDIIHYFEENESRLEEYPYLYTFAISTLLDMQIEAEIYEEAEKTIEKISGLEKVIRINHHHEAWAFVTMHFGKLMLFRKQKFIHSALQAIPDIEAGLKKFNPFISSSRYIEFQYLFGIIFFKSKDYKDAEVYFDRIIDHEKDYRQDIYSAALVLKIIINYELGQAKKVASFIEKTVTYLESKNRMHEFETVLMNYLKLISTSDNKTEERTTFKTLQNLIKKLGEMEFERNAFLFEDIQSWIVRKGMTNTNIFYNTFDVLHKG